MSYVVAECFSWGINARPRIVKDGFATAEAAAEWLKPKAAHIEADEANPGCYDAIGFDGRLYIIEPANRQTFTR